MLQARAQVAYVALVAHVAVGVDPASRGDRGQHVALAGYEMREADDVARSEEAGVPWWRNLN